MTESQYWTTGAWRRRGISRRSAIRGAFLGGMGLAGAALIGCGDDEDTPGDSGGTGGTGDGGGGAATATQAAGSVRRGGILNVGQGAEPTSMDPHLGTSGAEHDYLYMVYDHLVGYGQDGQLDPGRSLAESWEYAEPTRLVLKLREGVRFHEGEEVVNAEIVKWNLERATSDSATSRSDLGSIESVEAVSETEVVVNLNAPSAPLLTNMGDRGGFIVSREAVERMGDDEFARNPVGTGPMRMTRFVSDASVTFEANQDYWRTDADGERMPYLDGVEIKVLPDTTVRVASLETGEIHMTATPSADFDRLNDNSDLQLQQFVGSATGIWYINHEFAPLDNLNFRKALAHSFDRANWINNFATGTEPEAGGMLTPANWAFSEDVEGFHFDLEQARQFLEASGLPESEWVVRSQPFGEALSQTEEFYAASVAQAGITIEWAQPERNGWATRTLMGLGGDGSSAMYVSSFSMRVDPDATLSQFYLPDAAYNSGQAATPETEDLLAQAREELDDDARRELYVEIQRKGLENLYSAIPLYYVVRSEHASNRVGGVERLFGGEGKRRFADVWLES